MHDPGDIGLYGEPLSYLQNTFSLSKGVASRRDGHIYAWSCAEAGMHVCVQSLDVFMAGDEMDKKDPDQMIYRIVLCMIARQGQIF